MQKIRYILTTIAIILAIPLTVKGGNAEQIINEIVESYNNKNIITADYIISANGVNSTGVIIMSQQRFSIQSEQLKCWYDGKTQWNYLSHVGEVNITEPTSQELEQSNPYAALTNIGTNYVAELTTIGDNYHIKLIPKIDTDFATEIELTVNKSTKFIIKALFNNQDNSSYLITISNYHTDSNYTDKVFTYDPAQLPAGVPVIDLR